jgi:hypothetical protein
MDSVSVSMCVPNQTWRASLIRANGPLVPRASRRVFVSFNAVAYENTQQSMLMLLHIPTPKITNTQGTQILLYHTNGLQKKTTAYSGCRYAALCSPRHGNPVRYYLFSCLVWLIREFGVAAPLKCSVWMGLILRISVRADRVSPVGVYLQNPGEEGTAEVDSVAKSG